MQNDEQVPALVAPPRPFNEILEDPKLWGPDSTEQGRLELLKEQTTHGAIWMAQNGYSKQEITDRSTEFFNYYRLNAVDNGIMPGEHASARLIKSVSDTVFGSAQGIGSVGETVSRKEGLGDASDEALSNIATYGRKWRAEYAALKTDEQREAFRSKLESVYMTGAQDKNGVLEFSPKPQTPDQPSWVWTALQDVGGYLKEGSRSKVDKLLHENPALAQSFLWSDLPDGFGNVLGFLGVGAASGPVGVAAAGVGLQAQSGKDMAKSKGVSQEKEDAQVIFQGLIGSTEVMGLGGIDLIKHLPFGKKIMKSAWRYLGGGLQETGEELFQDTLVGVSEKLGGITPEKPWLPDGSGKPAVIDPSTMLRTAGVTMITGTTLAPLDPHYRKVMVEAQRTANEIVRSEATAVLDGTSQAIQQAQQVLAAPEATADQKAKAQAIIATAKSRAQEMLGAVAQSEQILKTVAPSEADTGRELTPFEKVGMATTDQVSLRDATDEEFANHWKNELTPEDRRKIRGVLGVQDNAPIAKIRDAFREQTKDVQAEPDVAAMALPELIGYHEELSKERGQTPSRVTLYKTSKELEAELPESTPAAKEAGASAVGKDVSPDDLQVLGANWTDRQDQVERGAIAIVEGKTAPLILAREKAQEWFRRSHDEGTFTLDELRTARAEVEKATGEQDTHEQTDEGMIEWASDYAVDYLAGKAPEAKSLPQKVREFFARLGEYASDMVRRAIRLERAIKAGGVSAKFENALAQASGLQKGETFNPHAGLSTAESAHLGKMLADPAQADEYLAKNDVSDAVVTAFDEAQRRGKEAQANAGKIKGPMFTMGRGYPDGYAFDYENRNGKHIVTARDSSGNVVGRGRFVEKGGNLKYEPGGVLFVEPAHRRKGIASAIYAEAERVTGKTIAPSPIQTGDGAAFSSNRKRFDPLFTLGRKQKAPRMSRETLREHRDELTNLEREIRADRISEAAQKTDRRKFSIAEAESVEKGESSPKELGLEPMQWDQVKHALTVRREAIQKANADKEMADREAAKVEEKLQLPENQAKLKKISKLREEAAKLHEKAVDEKVDRFEQEKAEKAGNNLIRQANELEKSLPNPSKYVNQAKKAEAEIKSLQNQKRLDVNLGSEPRTNLEKRLKLIDQVKTLERIVSAMPKELRGQLGGWSKLVKTGTPAKRVEQLEKANDKASNLLEKHAKNILLTEADKLFAIGKVRLDPKRRATSKMGPEATKELADIERVANLSGEEVADRLAKLTATVDTITDPDEHASAEAEMLHLLRFGNLEGRNVEELFTATDDIRSLIEDGKLAWKAKNETRMQEEKDLRTGFISGSIQGNKGWRDSSQGATAEDEKGTLRRALEKLGIGNLDWSYILNAITRADAATGHMGSSLVDWGTRLTHRATKLMERAQATEEENLYRFLAGVSGIDTSKKSWKFKIKRAWAKFDQHQDTGIERLEIPSEARLKRDILLETARGLQNGSIKRQEGGFTVEQEAAILGALTEHETAIASAEQSVADAKVDHAAALAEGRSQEELVELSKIQKGQEAKLRGLKQRKSLKGVDLTDMTQARMVPQRLSQSQAVRISMSYRQADVKPIMEYHGYDEKFMTELENWLTPEAKQLRDYLTEKYESGYNALNEVYRRIYGADLPKIRNYSPMSYNHANQKPGMEFGSDVQGGGSLSPGFTFTRLPSHRAEPNFEVGALAVYARHVAQQAHFIAFAEPVRQLRATLGHKDTQQAITRYYGKQLNTAVQQSIQFFADKGNKAAKVEPIVDRLRRNIVLGGLSWNWTQVFKQPTGAFAYLYGVPVAKFAKYQAEFFSNPAKAWKMMRAIPFVQERYEGGGERDIMAVLSGSLDRKPGGEVEMPSRISEALTAGMWFVRAGDLVSTVIGGYAAYRHGQETALKNGATEAEAHEEGVYALESMTEMYQTGGNVKDMSANEMGSSWERLFTTFLGNSRKYYLATWEAIGDVQAGRKDAKKEMAKRIIIGHIILPVLWQSAVSALKLATGDDDDREQALNPRNWALSMMLGPLSGVYVFGQGIQYGLSKLAGTKAFAQPMPILNEVDKMFDDVGSLVKAAQDGISTKDVAWFVHNMIRHASRITGGAPLLYDAAARTLSSVGLDDELKDEIKEPTRKGKRMN